MEITVLNLKFYKVANELSIYLINCITLRVRFTGRGEVGARPVPWVQQADQTCTEHDSEGRGRFRTCFHSAH